MQHVELHRRHAVQRALDDLHRLEAAAGVDEQAAPGKARAIRDVHGRDEGAAALLPHELQQRLQPAQHAQRVGPGEPRALRVDVQLVRLVLGGRLHGQSRRRGLRHQRGWTGAARGRREGHARLRGQPGPEALERGGHAAVVRARGRDREAVGDRQPALAPLQSLRGGHQVVVGCGRGQRRAGGEQQRERSGEAKAHGSRDLARARQAGQAAAGGGRAIVAIMRAHSLFTRALAAAAVLAALSCGGSSPTAPSTGSSCSTLSEVQTVRDTLRDWYFWYQQLPNPDPASFSTPEAYLEAVRYKPLDTTFSYIANKAESDAFFSDSQFIGFGFRTTLIGTDDLRAVDVFANSPAAQAGLDRGSRFLQIEGRSIADIVAAGQLGTIFGPSQVGVTVRVRFADRGGAVHDATLTKALVTIPTVATEQVFRVGGHTVGYLVFENFVQPSTDALNATFGRFAAAGVDEVVLDLRYNGGGLVSVAQHLSGLIGGARTNGQVFVKFVHNDKQSARNSTLTFPQPPNTVNATQLVVVATRASASASELVINALRPFMTVTVVGDRTYGKPVGQYGFDFCDKTLFPVAFATRNARDEGDYFGGIAADCAAPDDITHAFGDPAEGSLAAALGFLDSGRCSASAASQARAQAQARAPLASQPHRGDGWRELVGAY